MANKIKYGLKNVYYAVGTPGDNNTMTYGTPVAFPGAVSLSLEPQGDNVKFYADNVEYWVGNGNSGYSGSLEVARVIDSFKKDVLGMVQDAKDVLVEDMNAPIKHFALLFQFEGDVKATKHVMYNCTCSRAAASGQTKGEQIEPQTETLNLSIASIYNSSLNAEIVKAECTENSDNTTYEGWNSAVYIPSAAATTT
jgi:phi13 family phage major tail protein